MNGERDQIVGAVVSVTPGLEHSTIKVDTGTDLALIPNISNEAIAEIGIAVGDSIVVVIKPGHVIIGK